MSSVQRTRIFRAHSFSARPARMLLTTGRRLPRRQAPRIEALEDRVVLSVTAVADPYSVLAGMPLQVAAPGVLGNDSDTTGTPLTVSASTQPSHGTLVLNTDGSFSYTPSAGYSGVDSFYYTAKDGAGGTATANVNLSVVACTPVASIFAGPRLVSVNSTQGPLLNAVLGGLLGTSLNLTAVDWTGLANASVNGSKLIDQLQTNLGLASPSQVLTTNVTLTQLLTAAAQVAQTDSNTAEVTALHDLIAQISPLTGTIQLGDLLQGEFNNGTLATTNLNALDLVTGAIQLFNFKNVATTPSPITISGSELSALGLPASVGSLNLYAQVVEPPIFETGPVGTQFHTAAIRIKLDLNNLTGVNLNTSSLLGTIAGALGIPAGLLTVKASLNDMAVYLEVASASGTITMINDVTDAVTVQAVPSIANVYIGNIADSVFFNRTHIINPATDLTYGNVGTLSVSALGIINDSATIQVRDFALGQAPASSTSLTFNPPYPAPAQTVGSSATAVTNLVNQLSSNLQVQVSGNLGPVLNPLEGTLAGDLVQPLVSDVITPIVAPLLSGVADPLLASLGIGIGEAIVDADAVGMDCPVIANNDYATTPENSPVTIPVLSNDAIMPGDTVTITSTTQPSNGTDVINPNGTITYTPDNNFVGTDTFTYTITDGTGTPSTGTVTVLVTPLPPVANNDAYSTPEGATLTVAAPGVQANDTNPGGGTLSSTVVAQPADGTLTFHPNGSFTYVPNPGFVGTDSFAYDDSNGLATSNVATVTLNVTPTPPPVANDDTYSTPEGTTLIVSAPGVLTNDSSPSGRPLTASDVTQPADGTLTFHADGSITYVPNAGFVGTDTFTYHDSDGNNTSNTATVTLHVTATPPPIANNDAYSTPEDTTLTVSAPGVLGNDSSPSGQALTASDVTMPADGTLTLNANGSLTYVPNAGFVGTDSFTYHDSDGNNTSNTATVTINVTAPANQAPVANNDTYSTPEGATLTVSAPGVQANDTNPGGGTLSSTVVTPPADGTMVFHPNGSFTYVPTAGFVGTDTFTYEDSNGSATSNTATVTINVTPTAPPIANDDAYSTLEGTTIIVGAPGVQSNDLSPSGRPLTSSVVANPAHGTLSFNANGSFSYAPNAGFVGVDSFTYHDSDGNNTSNPATVTINVTPTAPPVANNDAYSLVENTTLTVAAPGVLANDVSPTGRPLAATVVTNPADGSLTFNSNGSFTYVPASGFVGTDSFTYHDSDGNNTSNTTTVTINVTPAANQAPVANNDTYNTPEGTTLTVSSPGVQSNDTNPGGGTLTSTVVTAPSQGTLTFNSNGSFTYVPNPGFTGSDSFTYDDTNGTTTSNTATVTLNVRPPTNQGPVANPDTYTTPEGTTLTVTAPGVQSNDTNPGGGTLTSTVVTEPTQGTLTLNGNGSITYVPNPGFVGTDTFTYEDTNGTTTSNTATVTFDVTPTAPPVANNDTYSTPEGTTLTVSAPGVLANDTSPSGRPLTASDVTMPADGTLTFNANGSLTYVPNPGFVGSDSFTYHDSDGNNTSNTATVTLSVTPTAPPVANNDAYSTPENTTLTVSAPGVLDNDVSPTGRTLTPAVVSNPLDGTLTFNANGSFTYVPNSGFVGTDSFTYHDSDGNNTSNIATVTLTVTPAANQAPVANNDAYSTPEDTTLNVATPGVLSNDTSPSGNPLTPTVLTNPAHGSLTFNTNGSLTYVPVNGFVGSDSFTYHDFDGINSSNIATVTLNVTPTAPPIANNDAYSTPEDTTLTVSVPGVLVNDVSPSGNPLTPTVVANPAHGTLTFNPDGSFTYAPDNGFVGSDSFTYHDFDGNNLSNIATVTLNVTPTAPPVAHDDLYTTVENTTLTLSAPAVLSNDVSPSGKALSGTVVTNPSHGTLQFHADGSFTYVPNADFVGSDSYTYHDSDGNNTSNTATVTINVTPLPPVAVNDNYTTPEDTTLTGPAPGVQVNDSNIGGGTLTSTALTQPAHGVLTFHADGSLTYVPNTGFVGSDSFTYQDFNGTSDSNTATVTIDVTPAAPVANNDAYTTPEGATLNIAAPGVQANDVNVGGGTLTATVVTQPVHGVLTFHGNGSFTYVPNAGFVGVDTYTYFDSNGTATSNSATVTINVTPTLPPIANPDAFHTPENTTLTINPSGVLFNDVSLSGRTLTAALVSMPAHGALTFNANGSFTYVPATNFVGMDSFMYHNSDGNNASNNTTVTITVTPNGGVGGEQITSGPTVLNLARLGYHNQPTLIVLTFSEHLDPTRAQNPANYVLLGLQGRKTHFYTFNSAVYNDANLTVTLRPNARLPLTITYQLTVHGLPPGGLTDTNGVFLDGKANGQPGSNYVATFNRTALVGPSVDPPPKRPHRAVKHAVVAAHPRLSPAAVDAVLASASARSLRASKSRH